MFTKREHQILLLIAKGYNSSVMAEKLGISCETVRKHRQNIRGKIRQSQTGEVNLSHFAVHYSIHAVGPPQKNTPF